MNDRNEHGRLAFSKSLGDGEINFTISCLHLNISHFASLKIKRTVPLLFSSKNEWNKARQNGPVSFRAVRTPFLIGNTISFMNPALLLSSQFRTWFLGKIIPRFPRPIFDTIEKRETLSPGRFAVKEEWFRSPKSTKTPRHSVFSLSHASFTEREVPNPKLPQTLTCQSRMLHNQRVSEAVIESELGASARISAATNICIT